MKTFEEIFEELARHNDRSIIWNNWLEYVVDVNLMKSEPGNKEEFKNKYHGNEEAYADLLEAWLNELAIKLETYPYYDILGEFYEELVQSKSKSKTLGQVYTPPSVTNLLSDLTFEDNLEYDGMIANDPACGSARTLLAAHVKSGCGIFVTGADLDRTSCFMAVCNLFSHGCRGSILHMDTLEGTFYDGWMVNRYLYHGIPVPHIEKLNSPREACRFLGLNHDSKSNVSLTTNDNNNDDEDNMVVAESIVKPTGQTTLI